MEIVWDAKKMLKLQFRNWKKQEKTSKTVVNSRLPNLSPYYR